MCTTYNSIHIHTPSAYEETTSLKNTFSFRTFLTHTFETHHAISSQKNWETLIFSLSGALCVVGEHGFFFVFRTAISVLPVLVLLLLRMLFCDWLMISVWGQKLITNTHYPMGLLKDSFSHSRNSFIRFMGFFLPSSGLKRIKFTSAQLR